MKRILTIVAISILLTSVVFLGVSKEVRADYQADQTLESPGCYQDMGTGITKTPCPTGEKDAEGNDIYDTSNCYFKATFGSGSVAQWVLVPCGKHPDTADYGASAVCNDPANSRTTACLAVAAAQQQSAAGPGCKSGVKILGIIPTWYAYLATDSLGCPKINEPKDFVLIALAILDALMQVAAILAVVFIVIGGIKYTASQGSPESTKNAKDTIVNAIIGLVITILASAMIAFVARMVG